MEPVIYPWEALASEAGVLTSSREIDAGHQVIRGKESAPAAS
jgi:hypothetical protein